MKFVSRASIARFSPRPFQTAVFTVVDRCWGSVASRLVHALVVVKRNRARQLLAHVPHALIVSQIHLLQDDFLALPEFPW